MARSPSHALGQIIGYAIELAFFEMLQPVAEDFSLYLDRQGERPARERRKKVTWTDDRKNKHDLDFVLERYGSAEVIGSPAAFIESAWRRYTKHSVNKAGEIANSLVPLRRTYRHHRPFLGALVAGEWTSGGIAHMESQGINVLHLPVSIIVDAFASEGVNMVFDEDTDDADMAQQVELWNDLGSARQHRVIQELRNGAADRFGKFIERLREHLSRKVDSVLILPLHGTSRSASSVSEAVSMLSAMESDPPPVGELELLRVEIQVRYSNSDRVEASFEALSEAILWLEQHYLETFE